MRVKQHERKQIKLEVKRNEKFFKKLEMKDNRQERKEKDEQVKLVKIN